ncbi:MAG: ATP-binding protein [Opitutaceae bacterium]|nr:ATP-binding protein [Opitutaceae bacterium]
MNSAKPKSHGEAQAANVNAAIGHTIPALPSQRDTFEARLAQTWGDGLRRWQEGDCRVCGRNIGLEYIAVGVGDASTVDVLVTNCAQCEEVVSAHYHPGRDLTREDQSMHPRWDKDCPPAYQRAILADAAAPTHCDAAASERVRSWRPQQGRGLVLTGPSGIGKTHAIWRLARDLEDDGRNPIVISSIELFRVLARSAKELESAKWLLRCGVLVIDDLGKERLSPGACATLHELIDERVSYDRPTIITTRYNGPAFVARFAEPELGEDIRGRIAQACDHVHFKAREQREAA